MNYTPIYGELQKRLHADRPDYGMSGHLYANYVMQIAEKMKTRDILDYGAGKGTLQKSIPFPIQNYDPFIEEYRQRPNPAAIVVCTDVLEHIEPECLTDVLQDIHYLTKGIVFFQIATGPAQKFLADGRNAHLIQESINWWLYKLMPLFNISGVQDVKSGFICVAMPILPENLETAK